MSKFLKSHDISEQQQSYSVEIALTNMGRIHEHDWTLNSGKNCWS